jgi:MarR family transcriptional regulator, organic hydroperoxide resistance regulator
VWFDKPNYLGHTQSVASPEVETVLRCYPKIYFACHRRHIKDEQSKQVLSANQASILDHLDAVEGTGLLDLARHMGVTRRMRGACSFG